MSNTGPGKTLARLTAADVLMDLGFIADGSTYGEIAYSTSFDDRAASLKVVAEGASGAKRVVEIPEHEVREVGTDD